MLDDPVVAHHTLLSNQGQYEVNEVHLKELVNIEGHLG